MIDTEVNQFPSLTWHHLHINHSYLRAPVSKEASYSVSELSDGLSLTKQSLHFVSDFCQFPSFLLFKFCCNCTNIRL